jgi:hypothetical protein
MLGEEADSYGQAERRPSDGYDPLEITIHQENTPPELRPQVFAILLAAEMTAVPLSMLAHGTLIGVGGLRAATMLFGMGNLFLGAFAILAPATRNLRPPHRQAWAQATATSGTPVLHESEWAQVIRPATSACRVCTRTEALQFDRSLDPRIRRATTR